MPRDEPAKPGLAQRLAWFALLWLASVTAVGLVSLAIKWALK
jgi:hypothetical protein